MDTRLVRALTPLVDAFNQLGLERCVPEDPKYST